MPAESEQDQDKHYQNDDALRPDGAGGYFIYDGGDRRQCQICGNKDHSTDEH